MGRESTTWVGMHCTLYPTPPHTIHLPLTDQVLGESVNCISEVPDTRYSVKQVVRSKQKETELNEA